MQDHFKGFNSNVVFYENVFGEYFRSIDEIVIGEWSLRDEDGDIYEKKVWKPLSSVMRDILS